MEIKRDEGKGCAKRGCERGREKVGRGNMAENVREPTSYTHTPSRGSGWRIKKSFRKFISGTLPERKG